MNNPRMTTPRLNADIRGKNVRVVNPNLGVVPFYIALSKAREEGTDLIQIAEGVEPVCVIMDYGKWQYEQKKKAKASKQVILEVKQIQIRPVTDVGDMEIKAKQARGFLEDGHEVRLVVRLHGRELAHEDEAQDALTRLITLIDCEVKQRSGLEGKQIIALVGKKKSNG